MRVLLVTHYYSEHRGGVEMVAGELARRFVHQGAQVVGVAGNCAPPQDDDGFRRWPMPAWNFTERRLGFPYPLWSPLAFWKLGRLVRSCDVVHLHDSLYLGNVVAYQWARWYR